MRNRSTPRVTNASSPVKEIVQSPYRNVAGGASGTDPGGRCANVYAWGPVDSDICTKHSGSADNAQGASPRSPTEDPLPVKLDGTGLGEAGAYTDAILIRIKSRFIQPATTTATVKTMSVEIMR
jgi:hypothetical protein